MLALFCCKPLDAHILTKKLTILLFIISEDERATYKDKLNYVEQELAATKGRESALQERLLKELDGYQERYRNQVKKIGELEA
jgi:hypothetical protein